MAAGATNGHACKAGANNACWEQAFEAWSQSSGSRKSSSSAGSQGITIARWECETQPNPTSAGMMSPSSGCTASRQLEEHTDTVDNHRRVPTDSQCSINSGIRLQPVAKSTSSGCHSQCDSGSASLCSESYEDNSCSQSDYDSEALKAMIPIDEHGLYTSIGSMGHFNGDCKACSFANSKAGCTNGIRCRYCHFEHARIRSGARNGKKMRPCKGKRIRIRKIMNRVSGEIESAPDDFSYESLSLPPSLRANEKLESKLRVQLENYRREVISEQRLDLQGRIGGIILNQTSGHI